MSRCACNYLCRQPFLDDFHPMYPASEIDLNRTLRFDTERNLPNWFFIIPLRQTVGAPSFKVFSMTPIEAHDLQPISLVDPAPMKLFTIYYDVKPKPQLLSTS